MRRDSDTRVTRHVRNGAGFTLIELLISTAVCLVVVAALLSGAIAMQKCFIAQDDYARSKCDQMRLSDYLALDFRRALTVTPGSINGPVLLTVTVPDYYDVNGQPRTPSISGRTVDYNLAPVQVTYTKSGSSIFRKAGSAPAVEIAASVTHFEVTVQDLNKVIKTQITFAPRFSSPSSADAREATSVYNTTLLRNKRRDRT